MSLSFPLAGPEQRPGAPGRRHRGLVVYVEGPRDRELLHNWARHTSLRFARELGRVTVILGGRQPTRALEHLEQLSSSGSPVRGFCILDRDDPSTAPSLPSSQPGPEGRAPGAGALQTYIWPRRHIESYLLVPDAIRRSLRPSERSRSVTELLRAALPDLSDERALAQMNAKRLLGPKGPLARSIGHPLQLGRIARGMRQEEMHRDVREVLALLRGALGWNRSEPRIVRRPPRARLR